MQKETYTLIADFSITENLAYLSHQEILRMFQRALIRADVPLVYSSGFNPHPYLSIPFPRSVGTCSIGDRLYATVEFSEVPSREELAEAIRNQLPSDCCIGAIQYVLGKQLTLPRSTRYLFRLRAGLQETLKDHLNHCSRQVREGEAIEIQRYWAKKKRYKTFEISAYVESLHHDENQVEVACCVSQSGTVRVDELMQWLNISTEDLQEPVCRTEINWYEN